MFATTAYSNILGWDEQESRPELIKKPTKKGMKVVSGLSGFDPLESRLSVARCDNYLVSPSHNLGMSGLFLECESM